MKICKKLKIAFSCCLWCLLSLNPLQAQHLSKIGWKYYSVTGAEMTKISKKEFKNQLIKNEDAYHLYTVSRKLNYTGTTLIITSVPTVSLGSLYLTLFLFADGDARDVLLKAGLGFTVGGAIMFGTGIYCKVKGDDYLSKSISLYNTSDAVSNNGEKMEFRVKIEPGKIGLYGQF